MKTHPFSPIVGCTYIWHWDCDDKGRQKPPLTLASVYRVGRALFSVDAAAAAAAFIGGFSAAATFAWPLGPAEAALFPDAGLSSFLRSAFSIFARMSVFSFKNKRAFSRP